MSSVIGEHISLKNENEVSMSTRSVGGIKHVTDTLFKVQRSLTDMSVAFELQNVSYVTVELNVLKRIRDLCEIMIAKAESDHSKS